MAKEELNMLKMYPDRIYIDEIPVNPIKGNTMKELIDKNS